MRRGVNTAGLRLVSRKMEIFVSLSLSNFLLAIHWLFNDLTVLETRHIKQGPRVSLSTALINHEYVR